MKLLRPLALAAAVIIATGCSWFGTKKSEEYKSASRPSKPLEVPPELTTPTTEERFVIPDPRTQTTYSSYERQRTSPATPATPQSSAILPKIEGARLERHGDQRWLVVKGAPEAVWPQVHEFWLAAGYSINREQPDLGIMETDWYEDRARIPQDIVRRTIGRLIDGMYSTATRDKYRTRLEKGAEPGSTEIFVSHRGMEEVYTNQNQDTTKWQPRPNDKELEAEMLSRMMAKLGVPETTRVSAAPGASPAAAAGSAAGVGPRNAVLQGNSLVVNDSFDRAWRRVGLALDRVGFTVEDRDRSKGLFYVRYIDPEADVDQKKKESFWETLKFWKTAPKGPQPQFRIHVSDASGGLSQVDVQNAQGSPETGATGKRILSLLFDQLK